MNRWRWRNWPGLLVVGMLGVVAAVLVLWGTIASGRRTASSGNSVSAALARCDRLLAEARTQIARRPDDASVYLRVASLEMRRSDLLALTTYERQTPGGRERSDDRLSEYVAWRRQLLRTDPDGTLKRVTQAARVALRGRLDLPSRREALLLLADARARLGDHHGEAAALEQAARQEPDQPRLWLRLAEAYGRARRFAQAEAARRHALSKLGEGP